MMNSSQSNVKHPIKKKTAGRSLSTGTERSATTSASWLYCGLVALVCTVVFGLLFLLIGAVSAYATADPNKLAMPLSLLSLYATAFLSALCTQRYRGFGILVCGMFTGAVLLLVCTLLGLCLPDVDSGSNKADLYTLWYHLPVLPAAILGSFAGRKRSKVNKKKRKF